MNTIDKKNALVHSEQNKENFEVFSFDELNDIIGGTAAMAEETAKTQGRAFGFNCCNSTKDEVESEGNN